MRRTLRTPHAAVVCCLLGATTARAESAAPSQAGAPRADLGDRTVHDHDGFYFHAGTGLSGFDARIRSDVLDRRVGGLSTSSDLAVGGTPMRGVAVGATWLRSSILVTTEPSDATAGNPLGIQVTGASLNVVGPFARYYPESREGLHLDFATGLAALTGLRREADPSDGRHVAFGGGFVLGIGYEAWVGEQWSLGIATRLVTALVSERDEAGVDWLVGMGAFPNVLIGVTYH
jgi:hypothetical protein